MIYIKNEFRKIDKEITNHYNYASENNGILAVNIKIKDKSQIVSDYSFDENDKLNPKISEYISDKSKYALLSEEIRLNFYTNEPIALVL